MTINYTEAARLAYDCWCASFGNVDQPEHVAMPRNKQGKLEVAKDGPSIAQWTDLSSDEKKRWVDIAKSVGRYIEDVTIVIG